MLIHELERQEPPVQAFLLKPLRIRRAVGIFDATAKLIQHPDWSVRKEACKTIAAARNPQAAKVLIDRLDKLNGPDELRAILGTLSQILEQLDQQERVHFADDLIDGINRSSPTQKAPAPPCSACTFGQGTD